MENKPVEIISEDVIVCPVCGCALEIPDQVGNDKEDEVIIELGKKDVKEIRDDDFERFGGYE